MTPKVSIKNMRFFYGDREVIHDISMDVPEHEIFSLIGPAGSGITTTLRAINRLCDLTPGARMEGEILIDDKNIRDSDISVTRLRRRVGMVFDVPTPLRMSIYDNVAYGPRLIGGVSKKSLDETVEKTLRESALWDDVKDRLSAAALSLSGGQRQRLCIARVLALDPEVMLLDRPCSGLDPISTAKIEDSLTALKERITIILAPHNVQQARRVSDKVAFLLMGDLIESGTNLDIFLSPADQRTSDYVTGRFG